MAIREIRKKGDPILSKACKPVVKFDEKLHILLDDMLETLRLHEGVGLAGPQIGVLKRIFIIDYDDFYLEAINPEIVSTSGEETVREGCLSVPNEWYDLSRPASVTLKAFDRNGKEFEVTGEGIIARAFCHENDHLNGILFVDKLTEEEKRRQIEQQEYEG